MVFRGARPRTNGVRRKEEKGATPEIVEDGFLCRGCDFSSHPMLSVISAKIQDRFAARLGVANKKERKKGKGKKEGVSLISL